MLNVYRPPSISSADNTNLLNFIEQFCSEREVVLLGDFNLPSINWASDTPDVGASTTDLAYFDTFAATGLSQVIEDATNYPSGTIIDLFLLSHAERLGM